MRLALQALFCNRDSSDSDPRQRARVENELRNNVRSAEFFRKIHQVLATPLKKAPEVFADESFPDANIVAEYLDCQLESTEISDEYERVCGESPEILAEVADCYDILNNRLPQPMSAPKNCRRRLYYVAWEEEPPRSAKTETKKAASESVEHVYEGEYAAHSGGASIKTEIRRDKKPRVAPRKKTSPDENTRQSEVQVKIRSQKSGKRWFSWGAKGCLAFFIVAGGVNGFAKWRDMERSQTFDAGSVSAQKIPVPSDVVDETPPIQEPDEEYVIVNDELSSTGAETDRYPTSGDDPTIMVANRPEEPVLETRRGLDTPIDGRREGLEIPDVNNDAFYGLPRQ